MSDANSSGGDPSDYIEQWGILFENLGATRAMGKVLGALLVCDPPEQTAAELAKMGGLSAGSVSTATRAMVQTGMIERVGIPGKRSSHFRVRPGMWGDMLGRRMRIVLMMGRLAEDGMALVPDDAGARLRLEEITSYCRYVDDKLPEFIARWKKEWEEEQNR